MKRFAIALSLGCALSTGSGQEASAPPGVTGLLPNPSFELVEPPPPTAAVAVAADVERLGPRWRPLALSGRPDYSA